MKRLPSSSVIVLIGLVCSVATAAALATREFSVVGYLPEYRLNGIDWDAVTTHLTHLILFSIEAEADGTPSALDRLPSPEAMSQAREAATRHGTKLLLCYGGNSRSGGFAKLVLSPATRAAFVRNTMELLDRYHLDGVDLNWEYPRTRGEWEGLFDLAVELKASFKSSSRILTMAFYPGQERVFVPKAVESVDLFLSMAYDNVCARGETPPCRHSTMKFARDVIRDVAGAGTIPLSKLALGVPFYARDTSTGEAETYSAMVRQYWPGRMGPKTDEVDRWYFNGQVTLAKKTRLAWKKGLGGIMIWEIGQDVHPSHEASLLSAVSVATMELRKDAPATKEL